MTSRNSALWIVLVLSLTSVVQVVSLVTAPTPATAAASISGEVGSYHFADSATSAVSCGFKDGEISSIAVPRPRVQERSYWHQVHDNVIWDSQYVRWTVYLQTKSGSRWLTVDNEKRQVKAKYHRWTSLPAVSSFTGSVLRSGYAAYRIEEVLTWYNPNTRSAEGTATERIQHYKYSYSTSGRSDCQNRAPKVTCTATASTSPGQGNGLTVAPTDPDGDSPLKLKVVNVTSGGTPVSGFVSIANQVELLFHPTAAEVGQVFNVVYEAVDPAGAASVPCTVMVTVSKMSSGGSVSSQIKITEGPSARGLPNCAATSCYYIVLTLSGFVGSITCSFNSAFGTAGFVDATFDSNGTHVTDNYYGHPGSWVSATCNGVDSGQQNWE